MIDGAAPLVIPAPVAAAPVAATRKHPSRNLFTAGFLPLLPSRFAGKPAAFLNRQTIPLDAFAVHAICRRAPMKPTWRLAYPGGNR
jgi:hypothetical protein